MSSIVELLSPEDKPALLGLSTPEFIGTAESILTELGYKVHLAGSHEEFMNRFGQIQYQLVVTEELFCSTSREENTSLRTLQWLPMNLRRHTTILLIGESFQTLNSMQAYNQSVHCVINPQELVPMLGQLIQKSTADSTLFMHVYRETQARIAQGKA